MSLDYGWRYEPARRRKCTRCGGSREDPDTTTARMISPTGVSRDVVGTWNTKVAREYVRLWAPERCTPEQRREL